MLKEARLEAGLTQKQLAVRLNTPHTRISDYERGERRLDLIQLTEYCEALDIDLRKFVDRFLDAYRAVNNPEPQTECTVS